MSEAIQWHIFSATHQREEDEIIIDIQRRIVSEANINTEHDSDDGKTHEDSIRR